MKVDVHPPADAAAEDAEPLDVDNDLEEHPHALKSKALKRLRSDTPASSEAQSEMSGSSSSSSIWRYLEFGDGDVFSYTVLVRETMYHLLYPATLPLILALEGVKGARNRLFVPPGGLAWFQFFLGAAVIAANVLYFALQSEMGAVTAFEVIMMDVLLLLRCVVVGFKYASIGRFEVLRRREVVTSDEERSRELLIAGWFHSPSDVISAQLRVAFRRAGVDERAMLDFGAADTIKLRKRLEGAEVFSKQLVCPETGRCPLSVALAQTLLESQMFVPSSAEWLQKYGSYLIALVHSLIPVVTRLVEGDPPFGDTAPQIFVVSVTFIASVFLFWNSVAFMLVGIADFARRHAVLWLWGSALQSEGNAARRLNKRVGKHSFMPFVDVVRSPQNAINWLRGVLILQSYGTFYRRRVEFSLSLYLVYTVALIAYCITELTGGGVEMLTVLTVVYDMMLLGIAVTWMALIGTKANNQLHIHASTLVHEQLRVRERMALGQMEDIHFADHEQDKGVCLQRADSVLSVVLKVLETDSRQLALRLIGIRIGTSLSGLLTTLFVAGVGIAIRILFV